MIAALIVAAALPSPFSPFQSYGSSPTWASIQWTFNGITTRTEIVPGESYGMPHGVWVATDLTRFGEDVTPSWTDSRSCPGVKTAVEAIEEFPEVQILPAGEKAFEPGLAPPIDGQDYVLSVDGRFAGTGNDGTRLTLHFRGGSPLAARTEAILDGLRSCWKRGLPQP